MNPISRQHVAQTVNLLAAASIENEAQLQPFFRERLQENSDEENDFSRPNFDSFYFQNGSQTILTLTNFSGREFDNIWGVVQNITTNNWNCGRGRRYTFRQKEIFSMTLTTFKHGWKWDFLGQMFNIQGTTFQKVILKFISAVSTELCNHFVNGNDGRWTMKKMLRHGLVFIYFPYCRYTTDVIFQQSLRPSGKLVEGKTYFSGKHKLYRFKNEVSVLPNGLAIVTSNHAPGSKADIDIVYEIIGDHKTALNKREYEGINFVLDSGEMLEQYSNCWGVLMDKGYQRASEHFRAIHRKKKPARGILSIDEEQKNKKISSDRIIVENFFGRLTLLWNILASKYRWSEYVYDEIFMFCVSLSNAHIMWPPLRARGGEHYNRNRNRLLSIGNEIVTKRRLSQKKYRAKRQRRMESRHHDISSDDETINPNN